MPDDYRMVKREVHLSDIVDTPGWDWEKVLANRRRRTWRTFLPVMFAPWNVVLAPKGTPCEVTTLGGMPIYRFKQYKGGAYCLQPEGSPGFPGS